MLPISFPMFILCHTQNGIIRICWPFSSDGVQMCHVLVVEHYTVAQNDLSNCAYAERHEQNDHPHQCVCCCVPNVEHVLLFAILCQQHLHDDGKLLNTIVVDVLVAVLGDVVCAASMECYHRLRHYVIAAELGYTLAKHRAPSNEIARSTHSHWVKRNYVRFRVTRARIQQPLILLQSDSSVLGDTQWHVSAAGGTISNFARSRYLMLTTNAHAHTFHISHATDTCQKSKCCSWKETGAYPWPSASHTLHAHAFGLPLSHSDYASARKRIHCEIQLFCIDRIILMVCGLHTWYHRMRKPFMKTINNEWHSPSLDKRATALSCIATAHLPGIGVKSFEIAWITWPPCMHM